MPTVGLISDTHNLVRTEVKNALAGVDHIIHAGDICVPSVLEELRAIAPLTAVRGNNDRGEWANALHTTNVIEIGGVTIYVLHNLGELDLDVVAAGFDVVVSGHSHKPLVKEQEGVLFVNPGSAGPRRFTLPISLAILTIEDGIPSAELRTLHD